MTTGSSTQGIQIRTRQRWLGEAVEVVSSMRFAISLLTLIAIASVIGTVMKQNEPMPNYVNQFGPFWFEIFGKAGLYAVYSAWWFLLIMGFLVLSTSLCIARNAPKMLRDVKSWRDNVRGRWQSPSSLTRRTRPESQLRSPKSHVTPSNMRVVVWWSFAWKNFRNQHW